MRFDKMTIKVQEAIQEAQTLANTYGHQVIDVEHLLLALVRQPEGITAAILKKLGPTRGQQRNPCRHILSGYQRLTVPARGNPISVPV